jgi:hypothetical protein
MDTVLITTLKNYTKALGHYINTKGIAIVAT